MEQILPIFREILELPDLVFEINQRLDVIQRQFDDFRGVDGATVDLSGIDHGALAGLAGDDHPQYHNDSRGDIKYYTKTLLNAGQLNSLYYTETELDTLLAAKVANSLFNATTFLYATSDNTPQPKTPAEVMVILSGQAGAEFSFNTQKIGGVVDPTTDQQVATKKYVDDNIGGGAVDVVSNVATDRILGRITAGSGDSEELTPAEVMAILSGQAGAAFDFNSQNLTSVGTIGCGAITVSRADTGNFFLFKRAGVNAATLYADSNHLFLKALRVGAKLQLCVNNEATPSLDLLSNRDVNVVYHNASTIGLKLGGTLVDALATDINLIKKSGRAQGDLLYASAANTLAWLAKGSDNQILKMNGNVPNWEAESAGAHTHDGDTLQLDGVNSDGGAFLFTTTGGVQFNQNVGVGIAASAAIRIYGFAPDAQSVIYYGVYGYTLSDQSGNYGVLGQATGGGGAVNVGVYGAASNATSNNYPFRDMHNNYSDATGWQDVSDRKMKTLIRDLENKDYENFYNILDKLHVHGYRYKGEAVKDMYMSKKGEPIITYDEKKFPKLIEKYGLIADDPDLPDFLASKDRKGIAAGRIAAYLVAVVQYQKKLIGDLERRLA